MAVKYFQFVVVIINIRFCQHIMQYYRISRYASRCGTSACSVTPNSEMVRFPFCALRDISGAITLPYDNSRLKSMSCRTHCCLTIGNDCGYAREAA